MTIHRSVQWFSRPTTLIAGLTLLGAVALPSSAAGRQATWRALFPPTAAYPHGTHLSPVHANKRADALVDPDTAAHAARDGFIVGGIQYATLPARGVASVIILTFRTSGGAATFLRQDHPTALADPNAPGKVVSGLGTGARYVAGACSSCGTGAPPLGILMLRHGTAVVQILTQPTDRALTLRLGHAALER